MRVERSEFETASFSSLPGREGKKYSPVVTLVSGYSLLVTRYLLLVTCCSQSVQTETRPKDHKTARPRDCTRTAATEWERKEKK